VSDEKTAQRAYQGSNHSSARKDVLSLHPFMNKIQKYGIKSGKGIYDYTKA
jgi:hypothetical protein